MQGADNRAPNVIATVFVMWCVGGCFAGLGAVGVNEMFGRHTGPPLAVLTFLLLMIGPVVFAWWWNHRRKPPNGPIQPWR